MIPIKLTVRNFMCYRGEGAMLDLSGVHLACLSGDNGAGKSALLGAITWALWGKARERVSDDELMSQGASEMEVEYEFALGEADYRVVRKRSRKASTGTTILELHMRASSGFITDGDAEVDTVEEDSDTDDNSKLKTQNSKLLTTWRPVTGHNVRDTQAKIIELLKMEYETFINSAFILQGRADEFTVKNPADRKKVLADILGLEEYDRLEERAKEEAKERKAHMTNLEGQMAGIDKELLRRPEYAQDLDSIENQLIENQGELTTAKEALGMLQTRWQELQSHLRRLQELRERVARRKTEMESAQVAIAKNTASNSELEALLAQRDSIERGYADWQAAQVRERQFGDSISLLRDLEKEQSGYEVTIKTEEARLRSEIKSHERNVSEYESKLAGRGVLERHLAEAMEKVRKLEQLNTQHEDTRCLKDNLDTKMRTLLEKMDLLKQEGIEIGEKQVMLRKAHADGKGHANCPLCDTSLTADALARVERSYQEDIDKKREEYGRKQTEQKVVKDELASIMLRLQAENDDLKALPLHRKRQAEHEQGLYLLDEYQGKLEKEQSGLSKLKKQLEAEDYAHEARQRMGNIKTQMAAIAYSKEEHEAARLKVEELHHFNEQYHKLEGADKNLAMVKSSLEADKSRLASWEKEQEGDRSETAVLEAQVEAPVGAGHGSPLQEIGALLSGKQSEVTMLEKAANDLAEKRGDLRGKIERCDILQVEKADLAAKFKVASDEKSIYDELTTAFGKKGIQAMIIENIIPELEDEANVLLHRMTDGRMSVHFTTQRDAKSNKNIVIETLDINISDEMGTRPYELYSGGEAFRANFAVRIALSKLLARRAGAQLQLLVIDEGFGTQDGQGREKLVGAIRSIQDDFQKILVVTHIEELKSEFPVRIDVIKTETGSYLVTS